MLEDAETQALMNRNFDLAILDGAYPECALGMVYQYKIPFMYMNTVGFYTGSLSVSGNPGSYAVTPNFYSTFTDNMNLVERAMNTGIQIFSDLMHKVSHSYPRKRLILLMVLLFILLSVCHGLCLSRDEGTPGQSDPTSL